MSEIEKIKSWFELPIKVQKETKEGYIMGVEPYSPFKVKSFLLGQMLNGELSLKRDVRVISQTQIAYLFK